MNIVIPGLHPRLADALSSILNEAKQRKLVVGLHSGLRTKDEQDKLYALGRTVINPDGKSKDKPKGNIVTNAAGYKSFHVLGLAADIVFKDIKGNWTWDKTNEQWEELGVVAELFGAEWGGRWRMKDIDHIQMKGDLQSGVQAAKILLEEGIEALWKHV